MKKSGRVAKWQSGRVGCVLHVSSLLCHLAILPLFPISVLIYQYLKKLHNCKLT